MSNPIGFKSPQEIPPELFARVNDAIKQHGDKQMLIALPPAAFICLAVAAHLGKHVGSLDNQAGACLDTVLSAMQFQAGQLDPAIRDLLLFLFQAHDGLAKQAEKEVEEHLRKEHPDELERREHPPEPRRPGILRRALQWLWVVPLCLIILSGCNRPYSKSAPAGTVARIQALDTPCGCNHVLSHRDRMGEFPDSYLREKLAAARDAGVQWHRGGALEILPSEAGMVERAGYMLDLMNQYGIRGLVILHPVNPETAEQWCQAVVNYLGTRASHYEIGNEPNPDIPPDLYGRILVAAARGVHASGGKVLNGGLAGAAEYRGWFDQVRAVPGAWDAIDVVSIHPYEAGYQMVSWACGLGKPVWITEDGRRGGTGLELPYSQSDALRGSFSYLERYNPCVEKVFWYAWCSYNPDEQDYCLWAWDASNPPRLTPKAAVGAYRDVARQAR